MNITSSTPEYGGSPHFKECKIYKQLYSLDCDVAGLHYMANNLCAVAGRLNRLQERIWAKDTGEVLSGERIARAADDYEADMDFIRSLHGHHYINKATFLDVCGKVFDQKREA